MSQVGFRDAIHVPFIVVICPTEINPGDKVSLRNDYEDDRTKITCVKWGGRPEREEPMWHGVADPFREAVIPAGEEFQVWIRKECFKGLRHDFKIEVYDRGGTDHCHSVCDIF